MNPPNPSLLLLVHAPELNGDSRRARAVIYALEHALPGLHLDWTLSEAGEIQPLSKRDAWLDQAVEEDGELPALCNGDESHLVTLSGWDRAGHLSPGSEPLFEIHAELPLDARGIAMAARVLEAVGDSAQGWWGRMLTPSTVVELPRQTRRRWQDAPEPPRGLPVLEPLEMTPTPVVPHHLGWVNYWSAATVQRLGFPDPKRDAELMTRSRSTAFGGWVVKLTDTPLDLDDPTHLDALLRAYARFPGIGGRAAP
ncbi:hypothetical protein COCOR_00224 [Corallococcus coralloides DSM 2259]|uniref:Uncharacterized protein n=1 Tax=Corallococcus coralloides (strain ATCC 25202 / DSM 2259 / NBRC 100086 / M2) TaxID=1144275 RepID=H8MWL4_CORCM|nr:DUF5953 family protein [Corallococcus coralloides]AFE03352.1 hypothetical protein COCOR_00224 [Corallococcus coralloides DSM 2259]